MSEDESSDYALWMALANDPSQPEEARGQYRLRMESYLRKKVRAAFQFAATGRPVDAATDD